MPNPLNFIVPGLLIGDILKNTSTVVTIEDPYKTQKGDYPNGKFPNASSEYKATPVDNRERFLKTIDGKDIMHIPGTDGVYENEAGADYGYEGDLKGVVVASLNPNMSLNRVKRLAKLDAKNGAVGPRLNIDDPNVVNEPNNWDYEYSMFRKAHEDGIKARFIKQFIKWNEKDPVGAANAFEEMQRDGKIPSHWRLPAGSRQEKVYNNLRKYYTGPQYRLYDKPFADLMLKFANTVPQMAGLLMGVSGTAGKGWARPVGASSTAPAFNPTIVNNVARFGQASVPISRQAAQVVAGTLGALATNEAVKYFSNGKYNSTGELVTNPDDPWYVKLMADIATNPFSYPSAVYKNIANTVWKGGKTASKYVGNFLNNLSKKVRPINYPIFDNSVYIGMNMTPIKYPLFRKNYLKEMDGNWTLKDYELAYFDDISDPTNFKKYKLFEDNNWVGDRYMRNSDGIKHIIDYYDDGLIRVQSSNMEKPRYVVDVLEQQGQLMVPKKVLVEDEDIARKAIDKAYFGNPLDDAAELYVKGDDGGWYKYKVPEKLETYTTNSASSVLPEETAGDVKDGVQEAINSGNKTKRPWYYPKIFKDINDSEAPLLKAAYKIYAAPSKLVWQPKERWIKYAFPTALYTAGAAGHSLYDYSNSEEFKLGLDTQMDTIRNKSLYEQQKFLDNGGFDTGKTIKSIQQLLWERDYNKALRDSLSYDLSIPIEEASESTTEDASTNRPPAYFDLN